MLVMFSSPKSKGWKRKHYQHPMNVSSRASLGLLLLNCIVLKYHFTSGEISAQTLGLMPAASVCDNDTIFHLRFIYPTHPQPASRGRPPSGHHHPLEAQHRPVHFSPSCGIRASHLTQPSANLFKLSLRARRTVPSLSDMPAGSCEAI